MGRSGEPGGLSGEDYFLRLSRATWGLEDTMNFSADKRLVPGGSAAWPIS